MPNKPADIAKYPSAQAEPGRQNVQNLSQPIPYKLYDNITYRRPQGVLVLEPFGCQNGQSTQKIYKLLKMFSSSCVAGQLDAAHDGRPLADAQRPLDPERHEEPAGIQVSGPTKFGL